jgi:hypothetical protein
MPVCMDSSLNENNPDLLMKVYCLELKMILSTR